MTAKKFTFFIINSFLIFIAYHFIIWQLYTSQIFRPDDGTSVGDLGRMSYQVSMLNNRKLSYTIPKKHLNKTNYTGQKIDILTIGDSFSNGDALGENPYYQDFLANKFNLNILNISKSEKHNSLERIIGLYNNGTLAKLKPKSIIVGSVERLAVDRYAKKLDFNINDVKKVNGFIEFKTYLVAYDRNSGKKDMAEIRFQLSKDYKMKYIMMFLSEG